MNPFPIPAAYLYAAAVLAGALAGWTANGWRLGEKLEAQRVQVTALKAQGDVLAASVRTCSESVAQAQKTGAAAVATGQALLAEARRMGAGGRAQAERIEQLLAKPTPSGAGCEQAWDEIERNRMAGAAR